MNEATEWLIDNSKPEFTTYARHCDLYLGWDPSTHSVGTVLNPFAERIVMPMIRFRGLQPDIASLAGLRGPFSVRDPDDQVSLIILAANALGYDPQKTKSLFQAEVYDALGYFSFYEAERARFVQVFLDVGIDIETQFQDWECAGDFFFVPHHPRVFVLFDVVLQAVSNRYLRDGDIQAARALRAQQAEEFAWSERWPIYPEIARRLGFEGGMTWLLPTNGDRRERSLDDIIAMSFAALEKHECDWRSFPFVREACAIVSGLSG
jgi:hypothetical protein